MFSLCVTCVFSKLPGSMVRGQLADRLGGKGSEDAAADLASEDAAADLARADEQLGEVVWPRRHGLVALSGDHAPAAGETGASTLNLDPPWFKQSR